MLHGRHIQRIVQPAPFMVIKADLKHRDADLKHRDAASSDGSYVSNQLYAVHTRTLETLLEGKHMDFVKVDGADPENKTLRSELWELSGQKVYPQCFVDGKFMGTLTDIQEKNDSGDLEKYYSKYRKDIGKGELG